MAALHLQHLNLFASSHDRGGYFICRTDNSHKCVNFGRFENIESKPYQKKSKREKARGLRLYEKYYLTASHVVNTCVEEENTKKGLFEVDE